MNKQSNKQRSISFRLLLVIVVPLIIIGLNSTGTLERLSLLGYDWLFTLRGKTPVNNAIFLVKQDEASTDFYNVRLSDWPRSYHARLVRKLSGAGADLIVFDYDFSRPTTIEEDTAFARAIADAGNVILANRLLPSGEIAQPIPAFTDGSLGEGFFDTVLDKDGYWRRMIYMNLTRDGYVYFSLPMATVEIYEDFPENQRTLDDPNALGWGLHKLPFPDMLINYSGPDGSYPSISYYKILENDFDPSLIKGKIILVGNTHRLGKDFFSVPTDKRMSGLEVHANAIASILDDRFIRTLSLRTLNILILAAGLAGGIILFLRKPELRTNIILMATGSGVIILSSWYFFVSQFVWVDLVPLLLAFLLNIIIATAYHWQISRQREKEIRGLFGHYVSRNVVDAILSENIQVKLDGHRTEVTILFSDIRGFTPISEALAPAELGQLLNLYFDEMIAAVFKYDGTLDKLMGDAVMAFFGSPLEVTDHQRQACKCAQDMIQRLEKLNLSGKLPPGVTIKIGIGLHTGEAIVGNLGSSEFADYTVIGDTVNLASRIEGLNKRYATTIIISEDTYQYVKGDYLYRELDTVRVKGKEEPKRIYEMMLENSSVNKLLVELYEEALQLYRDKQWDEAITCLQQILDDIGNDGPSQRLIKECQRLVSQAEDENWSSITTLDEK
ncbi:adenylate cyclase 1 [bacterium BMS3Abin11]|nr:adenylate cyclase 1 [bacterium BMS3Abin11]